MKKSIESLMVSATPIAETVDNSDPDRMLARYLGEASVRNNLSDVIRARIPTVAEYRKDWKTLPLLIGLFFRAQSDGLNPLLRIGFTEEEVEDFVGIIERLQLKLGEYKTSGNQTLTKNLYDQIKSIGG
jgi:hypothetical protein